MRELTRSLLCSDVLADLGGTQAQPADTSSWVRLLDSDLLPAGGGAGSEGAVLGAVSGAVSGSTLKTTLEQRMIEPLAALSACDPLGRVLPPLKCLKVGTAL